ncbi:replication initiation protein [Vibrio sp. 10N.239.312.D08]|uniref:replication initiation protein n=1 Tax=Vibrio sp. 10N.239.312.D08 TaxID=3229978 RepID=UPI00354E5BE5
MNQTKTEALPQINLNDLTPPCPYSGGILKLKNEWVFADYDMSIQEIRLIYYVINRFDVSEYFAKDGNFMSSAECDAIHKYGSVENRSILLPLKDMHNAISCNSKSKSYSPIVNAAYSLVNKQIKLNNQDKSSEVIDVLKSASIVKCPDTKLKCLLLTFSIEFMPFIIGVRGYKKVDINHAFKFESPIAVRYYHWMLHCLKGKQKNSFPIDINTLRNRLALEGGIKEKHFYKRMIEKPLKEVMNLTDLKVTVETIVNKQKRGHPLQRVIFKVEKQSVKLSAT